MRNPIHTGVLIARCLTALLVLNPATTSGQNLSSRKRVYLRVPFSVDLGDPVPSSLLMGIDELAIDRSLEEFHEQKATPRDVMLADLLDALAGGEALEFSSFALHRETAMEVAGLLTNGASENGGGVVIGSEWFLGEGQSILSFQFEGVRSERDIYVGLHWREGSVRWDMEGDGYAGHITSIVAGVDRMARRGWPVEEDLNPAAFRYSAELGETGVDLYFNGKAYRWRLGRDAAPPGDLTGFYASAYGALFEEGVDAFAKHFTDASAQVLADWRSSFADGDEETLVDTIRKQNRLVVFVLDADPFYLVFYHTLHSGPGYDTLVRDPVTGEIRLTAFQMEGNVDALLKDRERFFRPVISPIASAGPDPDEQPMMPVRPQFSNAGPASISAVSRALGFATEGGVGAALGTTATLEVTDGSLPEGGYPVLRWIVVVLLVAAFGGALAVLTKVKGGER